MRSFFRTSKKDEVRVKPADSGSFPNHEQWRDSELLHEDDTKRAVKYPYQVLSTEQQQIRLLNVMSGRDPDTLRCKLQCTTLSQASADYATVSYCWGDSSAKRIILIDEKPVSIGSSAAGVLYRMRSATSDRMLWIDAICIDQNSKTEQAQQVALMGSIYSMSRTNLVWLGDDHGTAGECVDIIQNLLLGIRRRTRNFQDLWSTFYSGPFPRLDSAMDSSTFVAPLSRLFESRWFSRLWVAQEAALAPSSVCQYGSKSLNLIDILRCAAWLNHAERFLPLSLRGSPGLSNAARLWRLVDREYVPQFQYQAATQDLYTMYNRTRRLECSVPRDKIYALLGMFQLPSDMDALLLKPIYEGKSDMEVFRDATRFMLKGIRHLELLRMDHSTSPHPDWPSWVVDFARKREILPLSAPKGFCPDGGRSFQMEASQHPNELNLRGIRVDTIVGCTAPVNQKLVPDQCSSQRILNILRSIDELVKNLPQAREELYKTLIAGRNWQNAEAGDADLKDYNSLLSHLQYHPRAPLPARYPSMTQFGEEAERAIRYFDNFASTVYTRRFFTTKYGLFGIGPCNLEAGDILAILYGSQFPYILRQVGVNTYRLIGECYVNRIMHGEIVQYHRAKGHRSNTFIIV